MPEFPNMSAIGPVVGALWETAKSKIPSKCKEMAGGGGSQGVPNENTNFAKFGGGGPQKGAGSHEMSDLGRRRAASTASSDDFCGGESGHKGPDFKINEWQAAWNVTNAIQVLALSPFLFLVCQKYLFHIIMELSYLNILNFKAL